MNCEKHEECGRLAYRDGLCIPHIKGWKPASSTKADEGPEQQLETRTPAKATSSRKATKKAPAKKAAKK